MSEFIPQSAGAIDFRIYSRTDVGKRRQRNEDSLGVIAGHGVFLVADGMGGVDGGDFSSQQVVKQMSESFKGFKPGHLRFEEVLDLAERSITKASSIINEEASLRGISGMGTTVVVVCFDMKSGDKACVMHVGDSRVYRYRNRTLEPLTTDHSLAAESGIKDTEMIPMFMAGVITRAVGVKEDILIDRGHVDVKSGDHYLLCSDGLYNMVSESQMADTLSLRTVDPAADLVNQANHAGGFDNITVIIIEVKARSHSDERLDETVS